MSRLIKTITFDIYSYVNIAELKSLKVRFKGDDNYTEFDLSEHKNFDGHIKLGKLGILDFLEDLRNEKNTKSKFTFIEPETYLRDTGCHFRIISKLCLYGYKFGLEHVRNIQMKHLVGISIKEFSMLPSIGKKTLAEFIEMCDCAGIKLKP